MKKLLWSTVASIAVLSSASAFAAPNQNKMGANITPTVETITARVEQRLVGNPNLKLDSVTEADGKFTVRIVTQDGSLVEEKIIDPTQRGQGRGMMNSDTPLTVERTKEILEGKLAMRGNPNLKLGEITEVDGKIKATIVTQDGSLVNEFDIDPAQPFDAFHQMMGMNNGGMKGQMMGRGKGDNGHGYHHGKNRGQGGKMGMKGQGMMQQGQPQNQAPKQ